MKGTFDDGSIDFYIVFSDKSTNETKYIRIPFNTMYGTAAEDICKYYGCTSFKLIGEKHLYNICSKKTQKNGCFFQISRFKNINLNGGLTFEDNVRQYGINNFDNFDSAQKVHMLSFLERYCMDYEDVAKLIQKK